MYFFYIFFSINNFDFNNKNIVLAATNVPSSCRPSSSRPSSSRPSSSRPSSTRPSSSIPSSTRPSNRPSSSNPSSSSPSSSKPTRTISIFYYNIDVDYSILIVPAGINSLNVKLYGAEGGYGNIPSEIYGGESERGIPGKGGYINAIISVTPGQTLYFFIGKKGGDSSLNTSMGIGIGGFNGGGDGYNAGGGGGSTDIRTNKFSLSSRIIVAGGGGGSSARSYGGAGGCKDNNFGKGGGTNGGFGGNLFSGGVKGKTIYLNKINICPIYDCPLNSDGIYGDGGSGGFQAQAGGGGGYYGGGAGGTWGGGGGGSNYLKSGTIIEEISGYQTGDGMIIISYDL
jgi:hypothetical protein